PIEFHAQVIDAKDIGDQRYIVTDASRTDIDPLFRRKRNFAIRVDPAAEATAPSRTCPEQVICGVTCMEDDRLTVLKDAQELKEGDRIVFYRVGAYTMSYQSPFIESPPAVYVQREDSVVRVRRKGTTDDYLRGNSWTEAALLEPVPAHSEAREPLASLKVSAAGRGGCGVRTPAVRAQTIGTGAVRAPSGTASGRCRGSRIPRARLT